MATSDRKPPLFPSTRLTLAALCFVGCLVTYALRTNMSMAIVCMVRRAGSGNGTEAKKSECAPTVSILEEPQHLPTDPIIAGEFDWSEDVAGSILGAFFNGYLCSQVLGGYLATRFGGKRVILYTVLGSSVLTLLSPIAARTHHWLLYGLRIVIGFLQGATFPAMHTMWALWGPPLERSVLTGVSYAGAQIGNMLVLSIAGVLCERGFDGGWPSIFYSFGVLGVLWCGLWHFFTSDRPSTHKRISKEERDYIEGSLEETMGKSTDKPPATPWLKMLTSRAVWACWLGHFAGDWGAYTMMTVLPSFLKDVLGVSLSSLGFLSAAPYLAYFIAINCGGAAADTLREKRILSTLNTRRLAMVLALVGQAVFLVLAAHCNCGQETLFIIFLIIGTGISGFQYSGFVVNYLDIAPPFSGTIMGIGNTLSCFGGMLSPIITKKLTPNGTRGEWQVIMWLTGGILVVGAALFALLAKGEVEEWAKVKPSEKVEEEVPLQEKDNQA
ncbi:unnamed protein product, partial [Mesorhabditis belari]|uniref:Sialin n=1 Tax=Mesorhabditis belari TaxID=2138241 RepID=A0AAF3E8Z8_9BILA